MSLEIVSWVIFPLGILLTSNNFLLPFNVSQLAYWCFCSYPSNGSLFGTRLKSRFCKFPIDFFHVYQQWMEMLDIFSPLGSLTSKWLVYQCLTKKCDWFVLIHVFLLLYDDMQVGNPHRIIVRFFKLEWIGLSQTKKKLMRQNWKDILVILTLRVSFHNSPLSFHFECPSKGK